MDQNLNQDTEKQVQKEVQQILPQEKQPGKIALQVFAIVVLLSLVGVGVYAWQNNRVTQLQNQVAELKKAPEPVKEVKADPYANWKSYTTKYDKLTFKYPASLTLKDTSYVDKQQGLSPGVDTITLTGASGLRLKIWNGASGLGGSCPDCTFPRNDVITLLGSTSYLNYVNPGSGLIQSVEVATDQTFFMSGMYKSKSIVITETNQPTANLYSIGYAKSDGTTTPKPLATFANDPAMAEIKLVLESFKY